MIHSCQEVGQRFVKAVEDKHYNVKLNCHQCTSGHPISDHKGAKDRLLNYSMFPCKNKIIQTSGRGVIIYTANIIEIPGPALLVHLDLQLDSQQSQRLLYTGLSSSSQLNAKEKSQGLHLWDYDLTKDTNKCGKKTDLYTLDRALARQSDVQTSNQQIGSFEIKALAWKGLCSV